MPQFQLVGLECSSRLLPVLRLWLAAAVPRVSCLCVSALKEGAWLFAVVMGALARFCSSCLVGCGLGIAGMLVRELDACGKCYLFLPLVSLRVERG
jgi:hypothetical protein